MTRVRRAALVGWLVLLSTAAAGRTVPAGITRDVAVPMRDGVILRADLWLPEGPGPFPTLIYRTPYGKARLFETDGVFRKAVARGYAVMTQDVRGRYASEGTFLPYQQEGRDGYDTIEWAARQPWSAGAIGTFGLSYPGAVQWLAAMERPPHLKAMVPAMTFASPSHFWHTGGVWDNSWLPWAWHNIAPDLRRRTGAPGPGTAEAADSAWAVDGARMQLTLPLTAMPAFRGVADWYYDWLGHPAGDPWWEWAELVGRHHRVEAAVLNLSGWHDEAYGPAGAVANFRGLVAARGGTASGARTHLVLGPWNHGVGPIRRTTIGDRPMGPAAALDYDLLVLRWMDRWVKGEDNGVDQEPAVRAYLMGADTWHTADAWPPPTTVRRELHLDGGRLVRGAPPAAGARTVTWDPAAPVRDPFADRAGPHDYRALAARPDVLVFETAPLDADLTVLGAMEAELHLSTDAPDVDVWVKVYDVAPDGTAFNLMSPGLDVRRASFRGGPVPVPLRPGEVTVVRLAELLTGNRFRAGHRIRVAVMGSFVPHMSRNLQTGRSEMTDSVTRAARVTLHTGGAHRSRLVLPVLEPGAN